MLLRQICAQAVIFPVVELPALGEIIFFRMIENGTQTRKGRWRGRIYGGGVQEKHCAPPQQIADHSSFSSSGAEASAPLADSSQFAGFFRDLLLL